jgi:hypothetical protein
MMGMTGTKDLAIKLEHLCRDGVDEENIKKTLELLIRKVEIALKELADN